MEDEITILLCNGGLVLALIIVIILFSISLKPFKYKKKLEGKNTCLTITAKKNIDRVVVKIWVSGEQMVFERKRIRRGQQIDFVFPTSKKPIKLMVEVEAGNQRVFEV
ncbi:MAG: hypothetical protein ABH842_04020 [Candidatus Micrarchaeota archaeon]